VRCDGAGPSLSVADRGPGVPAAEREVIFERFSRGSAAADGGVGPGLAIGRELAHRMEGELSVEGTTRGTRFTLTLPVAQQPAP
jgi:signal transduction histidine kinase